MIEIVITRESVCAGDDGDAPHRRTVRVPSLTTLDPLLADVLAAAPLPGISGGKATWCVSSRVPLAVVAQEWPAPRPLSPFPPDWTALDFADNTLRLHFSYFAQQDPATVFDILRRLRLRP
jgi:hypothetical protein